MGIKSTSSIHLWVWTLERRHNIDFCLSLSPSSADGSATSSAFAVRRVRYGGVTDSVRSSIRPKSSNFQPPLALRLSPPPRSLLRKQVKEDRRRRQAGWRAAESAFPAGGGTIRDPNNLPTFCTRMVDSGRILPQNSQPNCAITYCKITNVRAQGSERQATSLL